MSWEVHIDWQGKTHLMGRLHAAGQGLAVSVEIRVPAAKRILREVFTAVSAWRRTAGRLGLKAATLDAYASAFDHARMDEARRLLAK